MSYATETTQVSSRQVNQAWLNTIEQGRTKEAADQGTNFVREIIRQGSNVREILVPEGVRDEDIVQSVDTDQPKIIVEKEPQSVATFVEFLGTPKTRWFKGPRYEIYFMKLISEKMVKNKIELMTYRNDIRKIFADNMTKDIADVEDKIWRKRCNQIVNASGGLLETTGVFESSTFVKAKQALLNRRRPVGKMLMTSSTFQEAMNLPANVVGNDQADKFYREGVEKETQLFGTEVVSSAKTDIYAPNEAWLFSPENFLGKFRTLQDTTMFIKQEADIIEFYLYEYIGIGIGNRLSLQRIRFT